MRMKKKGKRIDKGFDDAEVSRLIEQAEGVLSKLNDATYNLRKTLDKQRNAKVSA